MTNRGSHKLRPTATGARLHYLRMVEQHGTYEPRHGVTANHCLNLGWTETIIKVTDGPRAGEVFAWKDIQQSEWLLGDFKILGQRLTDAGRAFLDQRMPNRKQP